ncbi:MAG: BMP family ABC transporter substrate-binding protein [Oscillospiraceae bacterium]
MKKILALLLTVAMVACLFAGCQSSEPKTSDPATEPSTDNSNTDPATDPATTPDNDDNTSPDVNGAKKVAFVTDVGNIDDHSFKQYSYEGVTKFCSNAGLECSYYKPVGDTDQDRIDAINQAVKDGYGVVVMAGYLFGPACYSVATQHPRSCSWLWT